MAATRGCSSVPEERPPRTRKATGPILSFSTCDPCWPLTEAAWVDASGNPRHPRRRARQRALRPYGAVAQLARAPALQAGGRRFEPDQLHNARSPWSGRADAPEDVVREADPPSLRVPGPMGSGGSSTPRTSGADRRRCSSRGRVMCSPFLGWNCQRRWFESSPFPTWGCSSVGRARAWQA